MESLHRQIACDCMERYSLLGYSEQNMKFYANDIYIYILFLILGTNIGPRLEQCLQPCENIGQSCWKRGQDHCHDDSSTIKSNFPSV